MAQSVKNLIFGSDIPLYVKRKIEARQLIAEKDISPNESITSKYTKEGIADTYDINSALGIGGMPTDGIADNSSRTPIARMWCSVNIAENLKLGEVTGEQQLIDFWDKKTTGDYKDRDVYLKKIKQNHWEEREWKKLNNARKIYSIGNHEFNTFEIDANQQKTEAVSDSAGSEVISADVMKAVAPYEGETNLNRFLRPGAGITSVTSETETNFGAIKRTTVNFIVHNVDDFNKIYMKYFMKPGATIFVDFGYSTGAIYDIEEVLDSESIEDSLYGSEGHVPLSNGDLDVVYGNVVNYTATVREDGGYDCMVEIMSKNMALMSNTMEENFKDKVKDGLDSEILGFVTAGVFGDPMLYYYSRQYGQNVENEAQLKAELARAAMDALGGRYVQFPGESGTQSVGSRVASKWGVFVRGNEDSYIPYVCWGWFEDHILNTELGFADDPSTLKNQNNSTNKSQNLYAKFDSSNSFVTYNKFLVESMKKHAKVVSGIDEWILYPETWGSVCTTYNIDRKMVPERTRNKGVQKVPWVNWDDNLDGYIKFEEDDKKRDVMPLREMYISTKLIKEAMENDSSTPLAILQYMFDKISEVTTGIIDLGVSSNSYGQHSIAVIDKSTIAADAKSQKKDFLDTLLEFNPYSKTSIVKEYSLEYNMPEDGLGSQMAIESMGNLESDLDDVKNLNLKKTLEDILAFEKLNRLGGLSADDLNQFDDKFIRYEPSVGAEAGKRHYDKVKGFENDKFKFDIGYISYGKRRKGLNYQNFDKNKRYDPGQADDQLQLAMSYTFDPESTLSDTDTKRVIDANPTQYSFLKQYHDELTARLQNITYGKMDNGVTEPSGDEINEDDTTETGKLAKEKAEKYGHTLVKNPDDYWMAKANKYNKMSLSVQIQLKANLSIQGVAGIQPGHIFRIKYLPKSYMANTYFQVTKVTHDISDSWTTKYETVMRIHPYGNNDTSIDDVRVTLSYITDALNLKLGKGWTKAFNNLEPVMLNPNKNAPVSGYTMYPKNIAAVFKTTLTEAIMNITEFSHDFDKCNENDSTPLYIPAIAEAVRVESTDTPESQVYAGTPEFQEFLGRQNFGDMTVDFPINELWYKEGLSNSNSIQSGYAATLSTPMTTSSQITSGYAMMNMSAEEIQSYLENTSTEEIVAHMDRKPSSRKLAQINPTYKVQGRREYATQSEPYGVTGNTLKGAGGLTVWLILHEDSDKWLIWPADPTNDWVPLDKLLGRWTEVPIMRQDTAGASGLGTSVAGVEHQEQVVEAQVKKYEGTNQEKTEGIDPSMDLYCQNRVKGLMPDDCYDALGEAGAALKASDQLAYEELQNSYWREPPVGDDEDIMPICKQCNGKDSVWLDDDDCNSEFCDYEDNWFLVPNTCRPKPCCYSYDCDLENPENN